MWGSIMKAKDFFETFDCFFSDYEEGCWYCYYIYADGDVYVVTTKNNHVDICVQLN